MNPLGMYKRVNRACVSASRTARAKYNKRYHIPDPRGKVIIDNTDKVMKMLDTKHVFTGYHGTGWSESIAKQANEVEMEKLGKRIYFEVIPDRRVAVYAEEVGGFNGPVILELASKVKPETDEQFGTLYYPPEADVYIARAMELSEDYKGVPQEIKDAGKLKKLNYLLTEFFHDLRGELKKEEKREQVEDL